MTFDPDAYLTEKSAAGQKTSSFDPDAYLSQKSRSQNIEQKEDVPFYTLRPEKLGEGFLAGLQKIDEYTGAPIRKLVTEAVTGKDLENAPSGADQAKMMGATDKTYGEMYGIHPYAGGNISPADIYGAGLEIIQDPFVIGSAAMKGIKSLSKGASSLVDNIAARQTTKAAQRQAAEASAESVARSGARFSGGDLSVEQGGKLFEKKAPQSLDELKNWKPTNGTGELLGKQRLSQIEGNLTDLQTKPLKYHYDMMENPKAMKELKLKFENLPTDDAKRIAAYNQEIVDESAKKIQDTVNSISPNKPRSLADAGDDFMSAAKERYRSEKSSLAPMFEALRQTPASTPDEVRDLAQAIGANTKLGKLMEVGEDGRIFLQKNTPRTGISDAEHGVLSRVIEDMNHGMTFKEMQDVREFLRKSVDPMNPSATSEINAVRKVMLEQMEHKAAQMGPSVGDTFKAYAKNERARESIEKIIGGKIESIDSMFSANPERVVNKIFSNPNYAEVVADYVGPEKMQDLISSYINNGVQKSFDSAKGFQPHTLRNWLKSNDQFLTRYAPDIKQRMNDLADYGYYGKRFLDEVNPSGTAASLIEAIEPKGFFQKVSKDGVTAALVSETAGRVNSKVRQSQAIKSVNEMLGTAKPGITDTVKGNLKKLPDVSQKFEKAKTASGMGALARGTIQESSPLRNTADGEKPTKGPQKWMNDGIDLITKSDESIDRAILEKLKETKKGQSLLIEASSAKNPKAMDRILKQIRTSYMNGGE